MRGPSLDQPSQHRPTSPGPETKWGQEKLAFVRNRKSDAQNSSWDEGYLSLKSGLFFSPVQCLESF